MQPAAHDRRRTRETGFDAFLLLSFGGPQGPDEVLPFLRRVTAGRGVPDERLAAVAEHYLHFGGVSPITAQNEALLAALAAEFDRRGTGCRSTSATGTGTRWSATPRARW